MGWGDSTNNQQVAIAASMQVCGVYRLVLATSRHIAGVLEGPVARLAEPEVTHRVEQAAQGIAWEDWVPLQGGAQYAQGM